MAVYIDSANLTDISNAVNFGWVSGVTTNPTLLAREELPVKELLKEITNLSPGPVFYQLMATSVNEMLVEAQKAAVLVGSGLVVKILPTEEGFKFSADHADEFNCCLTAVFSPSQAVVVSQTGAQYIAIYYSRAQKNNSSGIELIESCASILEGTGVEIVAASLKSPQDVSKVILAGAHHIAAPIKVLSQMMSDDLSQEAIRIFYEQGIGL